MPFNIPEDEKTKTTITPNMGDPENKAKLDYPMPELPKDKPVYYYRIPGGASNYNYEPSWRRIQQLIAKGPTNGVPNPAEKLTYWEYPNQVAKYYNLIRSAPPGWQPPEWLDTKSVTDAYEYLKLRNGDKPWQEWKALNPADPGVDFLKGIATPPEVALWNSEKYLATVKTPEQVKQEQPFGDWNLKPTWQKLALGLMAPQTPDIVNRPKWTNFTASLGQGAMAGLGVGIVAGAVTTPIGGLIAGLAATGLMTYQSYSGNRVPLLNEIMAPFNWLSEGAERTIGMVGQVANDGFDKVLDDLPAAWQASQANYESADQNVLNLMAKIAGDQPAAKGEIWDLTSASTEPVKVQHTIGTDTDATGADWLEVGRDWISSGKAQNQFTAAVNAGAFNGTYQEFVYAQLTQDFKFSGVVNDLVYQTVIDPLNLMPFVGGKVGGKVAEMAGNERLAAAFKQGTGNILIDALPPGLQQLAEFVTKVPSSKGLLQSMNLYKDWIRSGFYPAKMLDMPDDMRVKFNDLVKTGVDPQKISIEDNALKWKDAGGAEQTFTGSRSVKIPSVEELSDFEKYIGGIDETYGFKELKPTTGQSFVKKLGKLTPAAQVNAIMTIFHHNISALMDAAGGDPTKMVDFFEKISGSKAVQPGDIGEAIMRSPSNRAIQAAVQYAMRDGDLGDTMLATWIEGGERRTILNKVAQALGEKPADVLQQLQDNPAVMAQRLNTIAPQMKTTPEFLTETLKVFTGDDPMPWSPEQFQASLVTTFATKMDQFFQDKYGLAPEHWVFRVSNALKGVQSLVLLGFNPAYFMNNWVNNLVTRAVDGVGGYMTNKQIQAFYERVGIFPKDSGLTGFDDITGTIIHQAQQATDGLSKVQQGVTFLNKAGIFSRLSGKIERLEGGQARVAGMKQFLDKSKRVDVGIRRMTPVVENVLDAKYPGMKEKIYSAINAGMNMKEIEAGIFTDQVLPHVDSIIDEIDQKYTPNAPGVARELLNKTGITDRLRDNLKNAKTAEDVDLAFAKVEDDFQDYLDAEHTKAVVNRAEEVKNMVSAERIPAVLQLFGDQVIENAQSWINSRKADEKLFAQRSAGVITNEQFNNLYRALDAKQKAEMRRFNEYQMQTYKGIVEALGIESEFTRGYVTRIGDVNEIWKGFREKRTQIYKEYFQRLNTDKAVSWEELQGRMTALYDDATAKERRIQTELDGLFAKGYADFTGWDATKAAAWRKQLMDMRDQIVEAQKQMREKTRGMTETERDAEYEKFNPIYNKMIVDMKKLEHDGAYSLMNKPAPEVAINVPSVERPVNINAEMPDESPANVAEALNPTVVSPEMIARMKEIGFSDEQISMLRPQQMDEAINQYNRTHPVQKVAEVVKAKTDAEDIVQMADTQKRAAKLHELGLLARADVEEQLRVAFPKSSNTEIQAVMTLMDMHADVMAKRDGWTPGEAARDVWYAEHIEGINGSNIKASLNAADAKDKAVGDLFQVDNAEALRIREGTIFREIERVCRQYGREDLIENIRTSKGQLDLLKIGLNAEDRSFISNHPDLKYPLMEYAETLNPLPEQTSSLVYNTYTPPQPQFIRFTMSKDMSYQYSSTGRYKIVRHADDVTLEYYEKHGKVIRHFDEAAQAGTAAYDHAAKNHPSELYQTEQVQQQRTWYYSQLAKTLETMPNKIEPEALRGFLNGKVKADELEWTGFNRWLNAQEGQVTKQDALDFIQENQVKVEEVLHGKTGLEGSNSPYTAIVGGVAQGGDSDPVRLRNDMIRQGYRPEEIEIVKTPTAPNRYERWTLSGGMNNRELLLTLPMDKGDILSFEEWVGFRKKAGITDQSKATYDRFVQEKKFDQLISPNHKATFQDGHFLENNVVAHLRFNDRIDADGKKVLFIEEIQSDWHQKGRENGYVNPENQTRINEIWQQIEAGKEEFNKIANQVIAMEKSGDTNSPEYIKAFERFQELNSNRDRLFRESDKLRSGIPLAPFSKNWDELAVKRAIRWAAENGYDRVAWTTGKIQADRYNLAKHVDGLMYSKSANGYEVRVFKKGSTNDILLGRDLSEKDLRDQVGVEIANKIIAGEGKEVQKTQYKSLKPQDLTVGGEGMHGFYDEKIPAIVQKYIKKWGGRVEETKIISDPEKHLSSFSNVDDWKLARFSSVPAFDITPEMRKSVLELGQPLFEGRKGSVQWFDDGTAVINAFESADLSTMVHEIGHIFRRDLSDADLDIVAKLGGLKDGAEFRALQEGFLDGTLHQGMPEFGRYHGAEEEFARGWERYLTEGDAPTPELRSIFRKFTDWMLKIYQQVFKKNGRVQGFESTQIGVDIHATVNGVSFRDIFDRMLVDQPNRPPSFADLVQERADTIKGQGRNFRFSAEELTARARKELAREILGPFDSEEIARAATEAMDDYLELPDGTKIDDVTIYDALADITDHPDANPWAQVQQFKGTKTVARGLIDHDVEYKMQFKVIDLDNLVTSDNLQGNNIVPNPDYPQEVQNRLNVAGGTGDVNQRFAHIDEIAKKLDPDDLLLDSRMINHGSPIVSPDNYVASGNGRVIAMNLAKEAYPDKWAKYQETLPKYAATVGIDPATFADMKNPVLVREIDPSTDLAEFAFDANKPMTLEMNTAEIALNDANHISDIMLRQLKVLDNENIEQALESDRNNGFVNRFMQTLSPQEAGSVTTNGKINLKGIERIINGLFAKVYTGVEGERMLGAFTQSIDNNIKTLQSAIMASLPQMAVAEGLIKNGMRTADLSISSDIAVAADLIARLRNQGMTPREYLDQIGLFGESPADTLSPIQKSLTLLFGQKQPKKIREFMRSYAKLVEDQPAIGQTTTADMVRTKEEIFNDAIRAAESTDQPGLFTVAAEPGPDAAVAESVPSNQLAKPDTGTDQGTGTVQPGIESLPGLVGETPPTQPIQPSGTTQPAGPTQPGGPTQPDNINPRALVEYALKNNVPVPPEVLLNYPDLAAKTAKTTEAMFDFDNGDQVPLDSLGDVTLTHNETLPVPDDVQALIDQAETYRFDNKQKARDYVQWVIDGEKGTKPNVPQSIIDDFANSVDVLRNHARDKSKGIPTQTATAKVERAPDLVDQIRKRKSETNKSTTESYQWLIDRAIEDARANKDAALLEKLSKLDVDRLPESDLNMLNQLVLGYGGEKVTPTDTLVQKVYKFNHGDTPCVANVYKDGRLIAYLPETPLPDTKISDTSRILGLDPKDPNRWVYEIDGEIKSVDMRKPALGEPEPQPAKVAAPQPAEAAPVEASPAPEPTATEPQRLMIFSNNDISFERAMNAHRGISFVPDERALGEQRDYVQHMNAVLDRFSKYATTPEKQAQLIDLMEEYKAGYLNKLYAKFDADSKVMSAYMVTGPSNFPVERNRVRSETAHKRLTELLDWTKKAQHKIQREISPETSRVISSDNPEAVNILASKLKKEENAHALMVAANKVVRKQGLSETEKLAELNKLGLSERNAKQAMVPDYSGRLGFPEYALTNSNGRIKNIKERITNLESMLAKPGGEKVFEGGKIVDNADENRIQIYFDTKPDEAMREKLKANGFRFAPSQNNAWQRLRNDATRNVVERLFPDAHAAGEGAPAATSKPLFITGPDGTVGKVIEWKGEDPHVQFADDNYVYTPKNWRAATAEDIQARLEKKLSKTKQDTLRSWMDEIATADDSDFIKPVFTEEKPSAELNQRGQGDLFSQSAEDLPLFSGTAPRAQDELFAPQPDSGQMSMFADLVPEAKPTKIIEIAVKENGSTSYVRIDMKKMGAIRQTLALHQGETMTARILDANGKVIASNVDPNEVVNPTFGRPALYQEGVQVKDRALSQQEADFLAVALVRQGEKAIEFALEDEPTRSGKVMILDAVHKIDAQMAEKVARKVSSTLYQEGSDAPMGSVPLNGTPTLEPYARTLDEVNSEMIRPMLQDMRRSFKEHMGDQQVKWADVSAAERAEIKNYLKGTVTNDLASTKLAALNYGDSMRNGAMLDYSRRYGFDNVLGTVFPYQFWYTRSMINWAKRMVDKPSWFAMYTRYQQTQQKMERDGMPTRLKGKVRIDMPWMPEWMGGGLWIDPVNKLFPFDQFGQPLEQFQMNKNQVDKRAEQIIDEMRQGETITPTDAKTALETRAGSAWDRAVKQAELELDKSASPSSMASMMMQPALWWNVPGNIAAGTPEKISTLPITRTGQTIRDLGKNTFLQTFTDALGGALAGPEEAIRKSAGLSEFGQWGDYYLDRTLAGMAADGEITADQARIAMIQRSGPDYEEAYQRVVRENTLKTPGAAGIVAAKEGANAGQVLKATLTGIFGGSLFSEGELKMRGLKPIYDNAWRKLDAGDTEAINKFFDDHPEYNARLALYDKPEERLHQFLIDSIWKRYMDLDSANRRKVAQTLGDDFENSFLNKETRSYDALDDKTLASWAQVLGSQLPEVNELKGTPKLTAPEYYSQPVVDAVNAFQEERKAKYPSYNAWQSAYYELPAGTQRKAFLAQRPQLKAYWQWKDAYALQHPEISQYFEDQKDAESTAAPAATSSGSGSSRTIKLTQKAAQLTIQAFKDERTAKFPDYKAYQDQYYLQPTDAAKKAWLAQNPYLQSYWDWKDAYAVSHPEIRPYYEQLKAYAKQQTDTETSAVQAQFSSELTPPLIRSILAYATGSGLSAGAKSELERIRKELAPEMTQDEFLKAVIGSVVQ